MGFYTAKAMSPSDPGVNITSLSDGLRVEWTFDNASILIDENGYSVIKINGTDQLNQPGYPQIPFVSRLVAVPPGSTPTLLIDQVSQQSLPLSAPMGVIGAPSQTGVTEQFENYLGSYPIVSSTADISLPVASLSPVGIMRGVNLFRLIIYPALPSEGQLLITQSIQLNINYGKTIERRFENTATSDPLIRSLYSLVINPDQIQVSPRTPQQKMNRESKILLNDPAAIIEVTQIGLTIISYADLLAINFPVNSIDPQFMHLVRADAEIPFEWEGDDDSTFEPGEYLLFFAKPRFSRWSNNDSYYLFADQNPRLKMGTRSADPSGLPDGNAWVEVTRESNIIYTPDCFCAPIPAGHDDDRWVWDLLQYPPTSKSYSFELAAVDSTQAAQLTVWLIGQTDTLVNPDHHVKFSLNEQDLGETKWNGKELVEVELKIPAGVLYSGVNNLTLQLPGINGVTVEGVWLDSISIHYMRDSNQVSGNSLLFTGDVTQKAYSISLTDLDGLRAYDVTNSDSPLRLTSLSETGNQVLVGDPTEGGDHQYWVTNHTGINQPTHLRLASNIITQNSGADYLIITPQVFTSSLFDLINLRRDQGLIVAVEDIQAIYDQFGDGRLDPVAIREFLANAYFNWAKPPEYVLLVGDGTSDPKQYVASSSQTFIPPYLADVDPWAGETAADNRFVTLDGDDQLPDMVIGRLPANSAEEVKTMVDKIVSYEQDPIPGEWQTQSAYIADNADTAGNFPVLSEALIHQFPTPPFSPERLYYSPSQTNLDQFKQALLDSWNDGKALMVYMGHASIHQWAAERFFHLDDIPTLHNGSKLPVLLELTCFTGAFQVPGYSTLDESLLRYSAGGVVAVWAATGLGISTGHHWLAQGFMESMVNSSHPKIGEAVMAGKLTLAATGTHQDLLDTYTLLGDPFSPLERRYADFIPLAGR